MLTMIRVRAVSSLQNCYKCLEVRQPRAILLFYSDRHDYFRHSLQFVNTAFQENYFSIQIYPPLLRNLSCSHFVIATRLQLNNIMQKVRKFKHFKTQITCRNKLVTKFKQINISLIGEQRPLS